MAAHISAANKILNMLKFPPHDQWLLRSRKCCPRLSAYKPTNWFPFKVSVQVTCALPTGP